MVSFSYAPLSPLIVLFLFYVEAFMTHFGDCPFQN